MNHFRLVPMLFVTIGLASCGMFREKREAVVVTAIPKDVERCKNVGFVSTDSPELDKDDGLNQLRGNAVVRGGNAVLVMSYANSTNGTAYACNPPLKPDSRAGKP